MRLVLLFLIYLLIAPYQILAQQLVEIDYLPTDEIITNPERGFHVFTEWRPGSSSLSVQQLIGYRNDTRSLIIRNYTLSSWKDAPLSENFLNIVRQDFNAARQAGIKVVLRFRYSTNIGDPDAPLDIIKTHLDQLKPVFEEHYDVIALMDAGFIGAWGEWHSSTNNLTNTAARKEVLFKILEVLPEPRFVNVRTPGYKMFIFNKFTPLTEEDAYTGSYISRTGHHNDGFLASSTDLGTYGNVEYEKNYLNQENRFVPMGGETGGVSEGEYYKCDNALKEMALLRWSHLNRGWYGPTLQSWINDGCMPEVERRLGYRFVLQNGVYTSQVAPGNLLSFELNLVNEGWASPFNARGFRVLLRSLADPERIYEVHPPEDPRYWHSGEPVGIVHQFGIPADMPEDMYELLLHFPDPEPELYDRPEYAIRTANDGTWESDTGFNSLGHLVEISSDAPGEAYTDGLVFRPEGTSTSIEQVAEVSSRGFTLHQNYPNPFNPSTVIPFDLHEAIEIRLEVFNILGQRVAVPAHGHYNAGRHYISFSSAGLTAGVYVYRLTAGSYIKTNSMMLLK
ncbi:MAG: DUF4832 domain-containing protein [Cyclonatronaceae bacterium]